MSVERPAGTLPAGTQPAADPVRTSSRQMVGDATAVARALGVP
jgi:hypothetical protein